MEDQPVASLDLLKVELDKQWSEIVGIQTEPEFQLHLKEGQNNIMTDGTLGKFFEDMDNTLKKYKYPALDRLGLFVELKQITDDGGKELGKHLSALKGLQHLQLNLKTDISDGALKEVAVAVGENLKSLENLRVEIANSNQTTDLGVNDFLSNVTKDLPCLTNIVFSLRELDEITDESVGKISASFNNLKILRSLDLSLIKCVKITDTGLDELMSHFSGDLKGLQAFSLSVKGCNKITDSALKNLIEQLVKNLGDLQDLKLDFSDCHQITDEGVTGLAVRLVNLHHLKRLSLWFTRCTQLTDLAVLELGNQISDFMKDIEEFHLDVSGQITDEGVTTLTLLVTNNLKNLQRLNLEFTGQVTDKGLRDIAAHIVNNALTVKDFNLNLSGCPQITAEALIAARNLLKHMPSITIL